MMPFWSAKGGGVHVMLTAVEFVTETETDCGGDDGTKTKDNWSI